MNSTNEVKKKDTYPEFSTICYKCSKKLKTIQFHVHLAGLSFALCPKHLKEYIKVTNSFMK